ncbi:MAG: DUF4013 domain-containing protein [Proteobacteria bacterium]|nr:DUF4013 domain-containing protein [Pseudomonadota bacterium]MCP4916028.1 DUF4013 domain-containing protein [Pseudomonadota bacterium]
MAQSDPIDIGAAFKYATSDPDWMKKMFVAGLFLLIPIIGLVAMLGWMREIFFRVRENKPGLPDIQFGRHIEQGWAPLVAVLNTALPTVPMVLPAFAAMGLVVVGQETGDEALANLGVTLMVGTQGLIMLMSVALNLVIPEFWRRGFHGELGPIFSFGSSLRAIRANFVPALIVFLGFLAANLASSIGIFFCYVGIFLTLPFAYVVQAHLIAQWDALLSGDIPAPEEEWELAQKG